MNKPARARGAFSCSRAWVSVAARALALGSVGAVLCACEGNPFASEPGDFGREVALDRLRRIDTANLNRFAKADPHIPVDAAGMVDKEAIERARKRFEGIKTYDLTIEEARASTLANNLDLQIALLDPAIARETVSQEEARFESAFTLRSLWSESNQPTGLDLPFPERSYTGRRLIEPGVTIPTRTGETVNVSFLPQRLDTNPSGGAFDPQYTSDLAFSISQPLLRNAGRRANTAALRVANYNRQAAEATTKLEAIRQLAAIDRSYWRLYQAKKNLEVAQQQYELASAQLDTAQRKVNAGSVAEIEVIRSQAGVSDRLDVIIRAQNNVLTQQRELKRVMNMPGLDVGSATLVSPSTPPDLILYEFDRAELTKFAVATRMEMLELELRLAADAANIDFQQNQALPLLSLDYTYNVNGLGGVRGTAFQNMVSFEHADWSVGLSAQIPIGNEGARSAVRRAILSRLQRLSTRDARELAIRQEVLNAIDSIEASWQRVIAARQSVILNTRALQAEQRQFAVGASTSVFVLDATTRLAEAQFSEISAITDYEISQVDLAFATGTLLGQSRVDLTIPGRPDPDQPAPREEVESSGPAPYLPGPGVLEIFRKGRPKSEESAPVLPAPTEQPAPADPNAPVDPGKMVPDPVQPAPTNYGGGK
ncbi:MAG: TolC family protein [Phycisphaeraceae bacterium]|nr:TolC family protein [Phycisphaeraceae bacterium]